MSRGAAERAEKTKKMLVIPVKTGIQDQKKCLSSPCAGGVEGKDSETKVSLLEKDK